jgi:predicted cupin superfamily sugar epimerase
MLTCGRGIAMHLSAARIIEQLGLKPHATCGFVSETFVSGLQVPAASLPAEFGGARPLGGVLYFLVTAEACVRLHRIRSDQMYHHYLGDPLEVLLLQPGGVAEVHVLGPDLVAGMRPQLLIPGDTFHAARVKGGAYALLGTSVWVRPEPADVEMADAQRLLTAHPKARAVITQFTAGSP